MPPAENGVDILGLPSNGSTDGLDWTFLSNGIFH
jgi:hypothetical protein